MPLHVKQNIFCKRTIKYIFIGIACYVLLYFSLPKTPLISVVIPTYNRADFVEQAIQSVLNQTYSNFEVLVIDDGSTDNSAELIQKMAETDKRIRYYQLKQNSGVSIARNKGLSLARGKYIAFLDSDDTAYPYWLETGVRFMEKNPQAAVGFTNFMYYQLINNQKKFFPGNFPTYYFSAYALAHIGSFVRRKFIERHNIRFNPRYISAEDWDFYIQIIMADGRIEPILPNYPLVLVRYHTNNSANYYAAAEKNIRIIRQKIASDIGLENKKLSPCNMLTALIKKYPNAFNQFTQRCGIATFCKKILPNAMILKHSNWLDWVLTDDKHERMCHTFVGIEHAHIITNSPQKISVVWDYTKTKEIFIHQKDNIYILQPAPVSDKH